MAGQEQCIVSVSLAIDSMDVDLIQNVSIDERLTAMVHLRY